ncbi:MAG: pentapeptide repeat-containing protein [Mycolicibacterium neoaurum]|uniref:pentapeptide repeat-containing protein n=1 Tax=Mycolicibacterium neoaurum TaxID=1795 RepID=UPI002FFA16E3
MKRIWQAAGIVFVVVAAVVAVHVFALILTDGKTTEAAKTINDARASVVQIAGGIGLVGGLLFTWRTYALSRTSQRAERFAKAVGQLGESSESVRAGGIYALAKLGQEDKAYWPLIEDLLSAHLRERAKPNKKRTVDLTAAIKVLGARPVANPVRALDLRQICVTQANFSNGNFENGWFDGASLYEADLTDSNFRGARMPKVTLTSAKLNGVDLRESILSEADLRGADFYVAKLEDADIAGAYIFDAKNLTPEHLAATKGSPNSHPNGPNSKTD